MACDRGAEGRSPEAALGLLVLLTAGHFITIIRRVAACGCGCAEKPCNSKPKRPVTKPIKATEEQADESQLITRYHPFTASDNLCQLR
jgi:hypothetical protein